MKLFKSFLSDKWEVTGGNNLSEFEDVVTFLALNTKCFNAFLADSHICSIVSKSNEGNWNYKTAEYDSSVVSKYQKGKIYDNISTKTVEMLSQECGSDILAQDYIRNGFYLKYWDYENVPDGDVEPMNLIPSKGVLASLCNKLGSTKLAEGINPMRDMYLSSQMRNDEEPCKIVTRQFGKGIKIFNIFSQKYVHTPQTVILDIIREMNKEENISLRKRNNLPDEGRMVLYGWKMNHFRTVADFIFLTEAARINKVKVFPGVRITISDTGDASFSVRNALFVNGGCVLLSSQVSKTHSQYISAKSVVEEYNETGCFDEFSSVFEKLNDTGHSVESVKKRIGELFREIQFGASFGAGNSKKFKEMYFNSMPDKPGTEQDCYLFMVQIPGMVRNTVAKGKETMLEKMSSVIGGLFR